MTRAWIPQGARGCSDSDLSTAAAQLRRIQQRLCPFKGEEEKVDHRKWGGCAASPPGRQIAARDDTGRYVRPVS
jgi:hypothetical protein